ncbi:MAG: amino acid adenylation domain-containing protein [Candidatus Dormiibacterota bacterium]
MSEGLDTELSAAKRDLLQERLRGQVRDDPVGSSYDDHRGHADLIPLSLAQEQLWYFIELAPESPVYNEAVTIRKDGLFDVEAFRRAFRDLVQRHEMWRSTFRVVGGEPFQTVNPSPDLRLPLVDLSSFPRPQAERRANALAVEEAKRPYDFEVGPMIRPLLVRICEDHHRLYLAMHHLIFDGVSLYRVVLPELVALYDAFVQGRPSPLVAPTVQYADYALWDRSIAHTNSLGRSQDYWRERLRDVPDVALPLDHSRRPNPRFEGRAEPIEVGRATVDRLEELSRESGCTLFQALAAAFAVLLNRYTGQDELVFGTVTDLRDRREFESIVGYCLTPLVVRCDLSGRPTFAEVMRRSRDCLVEALDHKIPFQRLVSELRPNREAGGNPIFQSMIVLEPPMVTPDPEWSLHQMEVELGNALGKAKVDLHIELDRRPDGHLSGRLIYDTDLFEKSTAKRIVERWTTLLEEICLRPDQRICDFSFLSDGEAHCQLVEWNRTESAVQTGVTVHDLVAFQAKRAPDRPAVSCGTDSITYGALNHRAGLVASELQAVGVVAGDVVALCTERSIEMVIGMLGILKAGATYLPLDPRYPKDRVAFMLADSEANALLTPSRLMEALPPCKTLTVPMDDIARIDASNGVGASVAVSNETPAYIMYTSGSTGQPKGVRVSHANVVNLVAALAISPGLRADDRLLAVAPYSFDMSVADIWGTLGMGALLILAPQDAVGDGVELGGLLKASGATVMQATPTTWQLLVDSGWQGDPGLRALCGGEALSSRLARDLILRTSQLWNMYGPTETTVWSACGRIESADNISVGRPLANTRIYILDDEMRPLLPGVAGELMIGGAGVARGYLGRPDLTAKHFLPSPFVAGDRIYRTGDRARFLPDGRIEHLGRLDAQLKIRGFRVEPGEIEAALLMHPAVSGAAVVGWDNGDSVSRLAAYIATAGKPPTVGELRAFLQCTLPSYMLPSDWTFVERLPLTANGKVNRSVLPRPDARSSDARSASAPPRTGIEETLLRIWAHHLGGGPIGVHDDFFELGGHSLLAVRLVLDVEAETGVKLRLATVFERGATVAGMAAKIQAARTGAVTGSEAIARVDPATPYLFFVQPDESTMLTLRHFIGKLGSERQVVGLMPETSNGRFDRSRSIEELAEPMLGTIRRQQAQGPYYVAGFSLGGLIAYELAGRLQAAGDRVAWLGILDCAGDPEVFRRLLWLHSPRGAVARMLDGAVRRETYSQVQALAARWGRAPLVRLGVLPPPNTSNFDWRGAMALGAGYGFHPHDAPMELFVSADSVETMSGRSLGWDRVHNGPIRTHSIPGDHLAMVKEPTVRLVVDILRDSLRATQAAESVPAG